MSEENQSLPSPQQQSSSVENPYKNPPNDSLQRQNSSTSQNSQSSSQQAAASNSDLTRQFSSDSAKLREVLDQEQDQFQVPVTPMSSSGNQARSLISPQQATAPMAMTPSASYANSRATANPIEASDRLKMVVQNSLVRQSQIHTGLADAKFATMFSEGMKQFNSVKQYGGVQNTREGFSLGHPSLLQGKYVVYLTTGVDKLGICFSGNRRYNEFFMLREVLRVAWPGLYIPQIPGKKLMGNKDTKFIIDRRYFLERFYLQLSQYDYLTESREFNCFARPDPGTEIEKQLSKMTEMTMNQKLANFQKQHKVIDELIAEFCKPSQRQEIEQIISSFEDFLKRLKSGYKTIKKQIKNLIEVQQAKYDLDREVIEVLGKYEEKSNAFAENNSNTQITADSNQNQDSQSSVKNMLNTSILTKQIIRQVQTLGLDNPYQSLLYFVRGECKDIQAMQEALASRNSLVKKFLQYEAQIKTTQKELEESMQGGFKVSVSAFKGLFKNNAEKAVHEIELQNQIQTLEKEEQSCDKLIACVDYVLRKQMIQFKKQKIEEFSKAMADLSQMEVDNSNIYAEFWSCLLASHPNLKMVTK